MAGATREEEFVSENYLQGLVRIQSSTSQGKLWRWYLESASEDTSRRCSRLLFLVVSKQVHGSTDAEMKEKVPELHLDNKSPQHAFVQSAQVGIENSSLALLLPDRHGFLVRSDYVSLRMRGCAIVRGVKDFVDPQRIATTSNDGDSLSTLIGHAIAGILLPPQPATSPAFSLEMLDLFSEEVTCRLSTPWISATPVAQRRLAFIDGRIYFPTSKHVYYAAQALGIQLVMLDRAGHYLQHPQGSDAHLREAFVEVDLTRDEGLPQRLANAVTAHGERIDAITTICDPLLPYVARANEILGLPTNPPDAFEIAIDKHRTRLLDKETDQAFRISSAQELHDYLASERGPRLRYPLVIKPCNGNGSEGVVKVDTEVHLVSAAESALTRPATGLQQSGPLVIESYIDGPEVDANLVLWDGEVIFWEVVDDFPSTADNIGTGDAKSLSPNFLETQMLLPSKLPPSEQEIIKNQVRMLLLKAGLRHGVFHCEARVKNSRMSYSVNTATGLIDLSDNGHTDSSSPPTTFLIEINARTAGYIAVAATHLTYGVDLFALQLLTAARDENRARVLAQPFDFSRRQTGTLVPEHAILGRHDFQYNASILFIHPSADEGGILATDLSHAKRMLASRRPELVTDIRLPEWQPHFNAGDKVPGPASGELYWLVDLVVTSTEGREDVLIQSNVVRQELEHIIELK